MDWCGSSSVDPGAAVVPGVPIVVVDPAADAPVPLVDEELVAEDPVLVELLPEDPPLPVPDAPMLQHGVEPDVDGA
jgi:hypothetical protein